MRATYDVRSIDLALDLRQHVSMHDPHRRAQELRRDMTDAELRLWHYLRDRRLTGHKFRRQHPIGAYFADFACIEYRLVVELDGGQHVDRREADTRRTAQLKRLGWRVIRFWDDDVLADTELVLEAIVREMDRCAPRIEAPLTLTLSPQAGRGNTR